MLLVALACTEPTPPASPRPALVDTSGGAAFERPLPQLSGLEFEAELDRILTPGFPDPTPVVGVYAALMALGDDDCPGNPKHLSNARQGQGGCTAESGVHYEGISFYLVDDELESFGMPNYVAFGEGSFRLDGDFRITDADGEHFDGGGVASFVFNERVPADRWTIEINGTFHYDPNPGWISDTASNRLVVHGGRTDEVVGATIDGGMARESGTVVFDDVALWGECEAFGTGSVGMRDEIGAWYQVDMRDDCSGCGELIYDERVALGEACVHSEGFLNDLARITP